ncbi:hypothetical protein FJZ36_07840 [Candidatus Poribacteria bacterium]|nr:hypothetical protein [Candidatus Poribacteria bacterium]
MSLTAAIVASVFLIGVPLVVYLLRPILKGAQEPYVDHTTETEIDELYTERERSYTALADLDFDYECGKLSTGDYEQLRNALMAETAEVLALIDERIAAKESRRSPSKKARRRAQTTPSTDDALENEIARYKRTRQSEDRSESA